MSVPLGQILPDSPFGQALTALARQSEVIVEIGTWYGEGSTRALYRGLERPTQRLVSIESDPAVVDAVKTRYRDDPRLTFLCGTVTNKWRPDVPVVLERLPPLIDLLLIDGGEYEAREEWLLLHDRCRWIALDDTREEKNRENLKEALAHGWHALYNVPRERNGWAIVEHP